MIRRVLRGLSKLRKAPRAVRADIVRAQLALIRALLTVRFKKKGTLLDFRRASEPTPASESAPGGARLVTPELRRAREIAFAVRRTAERGLFRATCLPQALATHWLLEDAGLQGATVQFGVRLHNGEFAAHAWVEYQGVNLVDSELELAELRRLEALTVRESA